jgi:subtilisin
VEKGFSVVLLMGILVFGAVTPTNFASADSEKVNVLIGFNGKPDVSLIKQNGGQLKDNFHPFINVVSATIHNHPSATGEYLNVWGVDHIDADLAHANHNGTGVNVVVIDTGINSGHNDIGGINGGWDFVNGDSDPADDHGHGTHVSGTIAGVEGNGGIIGVSPSVNLYGVKVLDAGGSGSYTNVINGIMWAATNGMDVANLSLGGGASTSLCDAVDAATDAGVLIIASAGNSGNPKGKGTNTGYPATCNNAIAVAATTQNDSRASFSSTGQASSLLDQSYGSWSGTSMAAPHVSGVAALVKDANSSLTPQELRS